MKTIKRRAFCKAAAAAVAGVLAPHAAAEALLPQAAQAVVGSAVPEDYYSFAFRSDHSETDLSHDFYYTDAFFENTALQYSHQLALATLGLVAASGNTYQSDALYWVEGEAGREDSIADAYQKLGFANAVYAGYQRSLNTRWILRAVPLRRKRWYRMASAPPSLQPCCAVSAMVPSGPATCMWAKAAGTMAL